MGQAQKHVLGRNQRFYATPEVTFGTFVKPTGANAMKVLSSTVEFDQERVERNDARQSRDYFERITRRKNVTFGMEAYLIPSGAGATPPDITDMLQAVIGAETIGGADVQWDPAENQGDLGSLSIVREFNGTLIEVLTGSWIESLTINLSGGDEAKVSFEGRAKDMVSCGAAGLLAGVEAAAQTVIGLGAGEAAGYEEGVVVAIVNPTTGATVDDNGGAGYEVSNVDLGTDEITVTPALVIGAAAGDRVIPFVPTETTAGSPTSGILGSLSLDAAPALPIISFEATLTNNHKPTDDEFGQDSSTDYIDGPRDVTGSFTVRARRDEIIELQRRKRFLTRDIKVKSGPDTGGGAGDTYTLDFDVAEFMFSGVDVPESEEGTFTLPFRALGTTGGDSMKLTHS